LDVKNAYINLRGSQAQLRLASDAASEAFHAIAVIHARGWQIPESDRGATVYFQEMLNAQQRLAELEQEYLNASVMHSKAALQLSQATGVLPAAWQ